jgi:uncharacterized protein
MISLIEQHQNEVAAICKKHAVKRLELFGSAARDDFDPATSDLDFFVEFVSYDDPLIADHWFGLQEDLAALFGKPIDLTSSRAVRNPYFIEVANRHRVMLYAA